MTSNNEKFGTALLQQKLSEGPKRKRESGPRIEYKKMLVPSGGAAKNGFRYRLNSGVMEDQIKKFDYMRTYHFGPKGASELTDFMVDLVFELYCEMQDRGVDIFDKSDGKADPIEAVRKIKELICKE